MTPSYFYSFLKYGAKTTFLRQSQSMAVTLLQSCKKKSLCNSNIDHVNDNVYTNFLKLLSKNQILTSIKGRNFVANLRKITLYNPNVDLIMIMCIQILVKFCPVILKILGKKQILMSMKGRSSVANLQK